MAQIILIVFKSYYQTHQVSLDQGAYLKFFTITCFLIDNFFEGPASFFVFLFSEEGCLKFVLQNLTFLLQPSILFYNGYRSTDADKPKPFKIIIWINCRFFGVPLLAR